MVVSEGSGLSKVSRRKSIEEGLVVDRLDVHVIEDIELGHQLARGDKVY